MTLVSRFANPLLQTAQQQQAARQTEPSWDRTYRGQGSSGGSFSYNVASPQSPQAQGNSVGSPSVAPGGGQISQAPNVTPVNYMANQPQGQNVNGTAQQQAQRNVAPQRLVPDTGRQALIDDTAGPGAYTQWQGQGLQNQQGAPQGSAGGPNINPQSYGESQGPSANSYGAQMQGITPGNSIQYNSIMPSYTPQQQTLQGYQMSLAGQAANTPSFNYGNIGQDQTTHGWQSMMSAMGKVQGLPGFGQYGQSDIGADAVSRLQNMPGFGQYGPSESTQQVRQNLQGMGTPSAMGQQAMNSLQNMPGFGQYDPSAMGQQAMNSLQNMPGFGQYDPSAMGQQAMNSLQNMPGFGQYDPSAMGQDARSRLAATGAVNAPQFNYDGLGQAQTQQGMNAVSGALSGLQSLQGYGGYSPITNGRTDSYTTQAAGMLSGAGGGVGGPSGDATALRQALMSRVGALDGPDRGALAKSNFDLMQQAYEPQFQQDMRNVGKKAAALGRIGAGMTTSDLGDVAQRKNETFSRAAQQLSNDAAAASLQDRLSALSGVQGALGQVEGADQGWAGLGLQGAQLQRAAANDLFGMGQQLRGEEMANRNFAFTRDQANNNLGLARANAAGALGQQSFNMGQGLRNEQFGYDTARFNANVQSDQLARATANDMAGLDAADRNLSFARDQAANNLSRGVANDLMGADMANRNLSFARDQAANNLSRGVANDLMGADMANRNLSFARDQAANNMSRGVANDLIGADLSNRTLGRGIAGDLMGADLADRNLTFSRDQAANNLSRGIANDLSSVDLANRQLALSRDQAANNFGLSQAGMLGSLGQQAFNMGQGMRNEQFGYDTAKYNAGLAGLGAVNNVAQQMYGQNAGMRDELRGERGFQLGLNQQAQNDAIQQMLLQNQLMNGQFNNNMMAFNGMMSAGYGFDPTNQMNYQAGLKANDANSMWGNAANLLGQYFAGKVGAPGGSAGSTGQTVMQTPNMPTTNWYG